MASAGSSLERQNSGPTLDLTNQNLHFELDSQVIHSHTQKSLRPTGLQYSTQPCPSLLSNKDDLYYYSTHIQHDAKLHFTYTPRHTLTHR